MRGKAASPCCSVGHSTSNYYSGVSRICQRFITVLRLQFSARLGASSEDCPLSFLQFLHKVYITLDHSRLEKTTTRIMSALYSFESILDDSHARLSYFP